MLHKIQSYIKFLWNSKNEHGVHSPFVYNLLTKCFYNKTKIESVYFDSQLCNKKEKLLNKIFHYFSINDSIFYTPKTAIDHTKPTTDLIYIPVDTIQNIEEVLNDLFLKTHNDTCFIFDTIHSNPETELIWKQIINNPRFTVTIDTYLLGIAFARREQEKEHFVIRA